MDSIEKEKQLARRKELVLAFVLGTICGIALTNTAVLLALMR